MTDQQDDPLAQFGLDAIDLRWTLKDIDSKRTLVINKDHLPKLIELGLVEMREDTPYLTTAGPGLSGMPDRIRVLYFAGENPDDVRMRWVQDKFIELYGISSSERR